MPIDVDDGIGIGGATEGFNPPTNPEGAAGATKLQYLTGIGEAILRPELTRRNKNAKTNSSVLAERLDDVEGSSTAEGTGVLGPGAEEGASTHVPKKGQRRRGRGRTKKDGENKRGGPSDAARDAIGDI